MQILKIIFGIFLILMILLFFILYVSEKEKGVIFYNFGILNPSEKREFYAISFLPKAQCIIHFNSILEEKPIEDENLRVDCSSAKIVTIKEVSKVLDAFLSGYNTKEKLEYTTTLSLQTLSKKKYYFLDFIQELNYLDSWNKKGFYSYLDRKKQVFLFGEYMDHLEKVIKESNTFNSLYEVLEKHGCQVDILSNSLSVELFDRSYIDNILVPQYYLYDTLLEDGLLNKEDVNKTIYPHIGMMFFDLRCK